MKNNKIKVLLSFTFFAFLFSACDVGLGPRLYLNGPILTILDPSEDENRKPIDGKFIISGTVTDENGIGSITIKAKNPQSNELSLQWQWTNKDYKWKISLNSGVSWVDMQRVTLTGETEPVYPEWEWTGIAGKSALWTVPIDLLSYINDDDLPDGQYQFTVTSISRTNLSDENSVKTINVILYKEPPIVNIVSPLLSPKGELEFLETLNEDVRLSVLYHKTDYKDPAYVGSWMNEGFNLQWQIVETNDIWALEILFYEAVDEHGNIIDPSANEDDFVFKMYINDILNRPTVPPLDQVIRPNGRIFVPDLTKKASGTDPFNGAVYEIKKEVTGNTILQVVVRCMNAAGFELQDNIKGAFAYWKDSDVPWIEYRDGMLSDHTKALSTVYPNSDVPAKAFDDDGVQKIEYSIYKYDPVTGEKTGSAVYLIDPEEREAPPKQKITITNKFETKTFSWAFLPPDDIDNYLIESVVYDINGTVSPVTKGYFRILDISMPSIAIPVWPEPNQPLWKYIEGEKTEDWVINVKGYATDAREISKVSMVWINPASANYAAMSQLAFFQNSEFGSPAGGYSPSGQPPGTFGWYTASKTGGEDRSYDTAHPNRVWELDIKPDPRNNGIDPETGRKSYEYSIRLNLKDDLKIQPGDLNYLTSQVFVFKAQGADPEKSDIVVWAQEGVNTAPSITIESAEVIREGQVQLLDISNRTEIPVIGAGNEIKIKGKWTEETTGAQAPLNGSTRYLNIDRVLTDFMDIKISNASIPTDGREGNLSKNSYIKITKTNPTSGTWEVSAIVGNEGSENHAVRVSNLTDALILDAKITNIGRNKSESQATWIIQSAFVKLVRIGSDDPLFPDGIYNVPGPGTRPLELFLEFSRPVTLRSDINRDNVRLKMNSGVDAIAVYKSGQTLPSVKQYFIYEINNTHSTQNKNLAQDRLNVEGLVNAESNYIWVFDEGSGSAEEVQIVSGDPVNTGISNRIQNQLPVTGLMAFNAGKSIVIDTTPPKLTGIEISGRAGWYGAQDTIYLVAKFNETVTVSGTPSLTLAISNGGTNTVTTDSIISNNTDIIFVYKIKTNDFTPGSALVSITAVNVGGGIRDIAGNAFNPSAADSGFTAGFEPKINNEGIQVRALPLNAPTLQVHTSSNTSGTAFATSGGDSATWDPNSYANTEAFINSGILQVKLNNYYENDLYIHIIPNSSPAWMQGFDKIEWSLDYGKTRTTLNNLANELPIKGSQGYSALTARQIDGAGNASPWSRPITLFWDPGALLTRVSAVNPSGTYTTGADIDIVLTFRKAVTLTGAVAETSPVIYLKEAVGGTAKVARYQSGSGTTDITFRYRINEGDTSNGQPINVIEPFGPFTATDGTNSVSSMISLSNVNSQNRNLIDNRTIIIQTGKPDRIRGPVFIPGTVNSGNANNIATVRNNINNVLNTNSTASFPAGVFNANVINSDDSVSGLLAVKFNKPISRGVGNITIKQNAADYRIPAVLTEAQYNLFLSKGVSHLSTYYKEGTNGFRNGIGPDTSKKYILDFTVNTFQTSSFTGNLAQMRDDMLEAESVTIGVNSSFVHFVNDPSSAYGILLIELRSTNSLKVPGASYTVSYPDDLVRDSLSNKCESYSAALLMLDNTSTVTGFSRPFIRSSKQPLDIITRSSSAGNNTPQYIISQANRPRTVQVRMDTRTPGSQIRYTTAQSTHNINYNTGAVTNNLGDYVWDAAGGNAREPARTAPTDTTGTLFNSTSANLTVGNTTDSAAEGGYTYIGGLKYRIYARTANASGNVDADTTRFAEEMLYRTALTFKVEIGGGASGSLATVGGGIFEAGDQLWVRGGNTLTGSTIPGYPLTMEGNVTDDQAGIRLMTKVAGSSIANGSVWQWITWDISEAAYITLYLGRETTPGGRPEDTVRREGPQTQSPWAGNWTYRRSAYTLIPGEHRWLNSAWPNERSGSGRIPPFVFGATSGTGNSFVWRLYEWLDEKTNTTINNTIPTVFLPFKSYGTNISQTVTDTARTLSVSNGGNGIGIDVSQLRINFGEPKAGELQIGDPLDISGRQYNIIFTGTVGATNGNWNEIIQLCNDAGTVFTQNGLPIQQGVASGTTDGEDNNKFTLSYVIPAGTTIIRIKIANNRLITITDIDIEDWGPRLF